MGGGRVFFGQFVFNVASVTSVYSCQLMRGRAIHKLTLFIAPPPIHRVVVRLAKTVVQMAISREHSEVIDQIFVDNREFFIIYNIHTPAFDAAINFNSFEYRINGGIQSASEMLLLKRKPGVARSFNCTPAFVGYASC